SFAIAFARNILCLHTLQSLSMWSNGWGRFRPRIISEHCGRSASDLKNPWKRMSKRLSPKRRSSAHGPRGGRCIVSRRKTAVGCYSTLHRGYSPESQAFAVKTKWTKRCLQRARRPWSEPWREETGSRGRNYTVLWNVRKFQPPEPAGSIL